jgi:hypothetical protein
MATAGSPTLADESAVAARPRPWRWAVLGAVLVLAWQALTVQANYAGNWSGLFRTGTLVSVLPQLASSTFRDPSPHGYDGQYYRFLAHDPFLRSGASAYLDGPKVRASRILVPLAAWALAAGRPGLIDAAYVLVLAGFIFAGVYWLASIMLRLGRPPALGLLFLVIPATVVSIDRMTVDVALGALTAGFVLYFLEDREPGMWLTAAAAGLVRETGLLLVAACVLAALFRRDFRQSDVPDLSFLLEILQCPEAFFHGNFRIDPVQLIKVDAFQPKTTKAHFHLLTKVFRASNRQPLVWPLTR